MYPYENPTVIATSGGVLVVGGSRPGAGGQTEVSSRALFYDRGAAAWRELAPVPRGYLLEGGSGVRDVPYLVGRTCQTDLAAAEEPRCERTAVLRLEDDGDTWTEVPHPDELLPPNRETIAVGTVGEDVLALVTSGDPSKGLLTYDVERDEWDAVPPPDGAPELLAHCLTNGEVYARSLVEEDYTSAGAPTQYRFSAWALSDGSWVGPEEVDLGEVRATEGALASEVCAGGAFVASNASTGGRGVLIARRGTQLVARPVQLPPRALGPEASAVRAGITPSGEFFSVSPGTEGMMRADVRSAVGQLGRADIVATVESARVVDLIVRDPADRSRIEAISVGVG